MSPRILAVAVATTILLGCSDSSGPSTLSVRQLAGAWDLSGLEMLLASDTTVRQDIKASSGVDVVLVINSDGSATLTLTQPGVPDFAFDATLAIHGDTVVFAEGGSTYEATIRLAGSRMTWLALQTVSWDIDGDGSPEEALERDVWLRR